MASKLWIKLYHEILDDPKMGRLPDRLFRRCMQLFLLAGEYDREGLLPELADMAWRFHLADEELETDLEALARVNIVAPTEQGWIVVHFAKRQSKIDGAERTRKWRDRTKKQEQAAPEIHINEGSDESVTERHRNCDDNRIDRDKDRDKDTLPNGNVGAEAPKAVAQLKAKQKDTGTEPGIKKQIMGVFQQTTGLALPKRQSDVKFWWSTIDEIASIAGDDVARALEIVRYSVRKLKDEHLTIGGPESIIKTCRAIAAGQDLSPQPPTANGHKPAGTITGLQGRAIDDPIQKRCNIKTGETYWFDLRTNQRVPDPDGT